MKYTGSILLLLAMTVSGSSLFAQGFEDLLGQVSEPGRKAEYADAYLFETYIRMEITAPGKNPESYRAYVSADHGAILLKVPIEGQETLIVLDPENASLLLLTEAGGAKNGIAMSINMEALRALGEDLEASMDDKGEAIPVGRTKEILGYTCKEYLIETKEARIQTWNSEELGKKIAQDLDIYRQLFGSFIHHAGKAGGMIMEFHHLDRNSGEETRMKVTDIDLEANLTLNTGDYTIMSMGQ